MNTKTSYYRKDDHELLGLVVQDGVAWQAQTVFGYTIAHTTSQADAERILREKGMSFMTGVWQYYDKDDGDWYSCVLKEVYPNRVIVIRTDVMGYQNPDDYKLVDIQKPDENSLIKET